MPHGAAAGVPPREREALLRKLSWLTLFRLVTITVLLGGTAFAVWSAPGVMGAAAADLFRLVLATYVVSLAFAMALHRRVALTALAYAHVALDVVIATCVAAMTGGAESVFAFMFLLAIVNGSILLFRKGAIAATAFALAGYVVAAVATPQQPPAATVFAHTIAFITTSALASYLSEQLRRTGERLEAREVDLAAITALHESIVQSVASGMVTIDATGRITFLNRAGELITGLRLRDVQLQPADRWFGVLHGSGERDETDFVNARGERLRVGYTVFPLVARGGGEIGQAIIFQDLTRLREMEAQVQRSERLADLGQLAAGLAHELRNPLASMVGSIELLRQAQTLPPSDARLMDIVLREAARLEQLVAAFLAFSRPATPRRERVALERAIGETLDVFAHDPAASRVRVTRALEPASAWCDPDQLRQVLWNLLSNAAQAAASGERAGEVRVACRAEGKAAAILVEDDGPGIPPQDVARIFTPFFTTKERGTGLGLAIVQRVVDAHGGGLTVEPLSDRGTRFTVRLPCSAPDPGA
ncbi:MAG TPA: ATP-binding protein [Anaeromyxobacteraceae bacterium]|nr:ATP-binding protein [Anaeromyxobacteraceae bacterium]